MTRILSLFAAVVLASSAAVTGGLLAPSDVQAAEQSKPAGKITTKAVAEPLKKAQAAMQAKQWDAALAEIKKAQAVEKKTPFEAYQIDEFMGYVFIQQKKFGEAAPVFERMINSGFLPPEQVDDRTKTVAQLYFQQKDYRKAAEWAKRWLAKYPDQEEMAILLGQSQYLLEDWKGAAATMTGVIRNAERNGQTPKENWINIVLSSHFKAGDQNGIGEALKKMVRYYPKPDYWENLLDIHRRKASGDRQTLGYYRLMSDVGVLKDKGDYMEMAQLAMDAGVPGEAEQVMTRGMENGTLKVEDKTEQGRYTRLLEGAKKQAQQDRASLPQLAKDAEKAAQGQADVGLAQAYLSYGQVDESITAFQRGLKKGGVTDVDEAQIGLGIAHLKKGQKDQARQAFQAVKDGSKWKDLAELWVIRTHSA